ncbi:deoxyribonuclease IV [Peptoniphilus sp. MSJ-1]|uniref:Probable endonuclease 4 n=1 Tax=Peptoniphilus ovalis TaxID=2841503 RepID=A0ABS6FFF7_9FIRM|nr:deoxyribonuclease IV [Peptoniphilus ovalis]MBU5668267.1 deoxyribonuclease IV [Peptoniphilus ovalis]
MFVIGCHLSTSGGYENMGRDALSINANTFQFFSRNPRGSRMKKLDEGDINSLMDLARENNFGPLLAHAPYTLNPCSSTESVREFANIVLKEDLERLKYFKNTYYNFHPGSHTGMGAEKAIEIIAAQINSVMTEEQETIVLLETMAGKGTEVGSKFEEIAEIIKRVNLKNKIGVCMDTCHIHEAGYDIVNDLDGVLHEFDEVVGLDKLYAIHLNDSKNEIGAHKDRHETIGEGHLGLETIEKIINHEKLKDLPFYLETPNELEGHKKEIELLRSLRK